MADNTHDDLWPTLDKELTVRRNWLLNLFGIRQIVICAHTVPALQWLHGYVGKFTDRAPIFFSLGQPTSANVLPGYKIGEVVRFLDSYNGTGTDVDTGAGDSIGENVGVRDTLSTVSAADNVEATNVDVGYRATYDDEDDDPYAYHKIR